MSGLDSDHEYRTPCQCCQWDRPNREHTVHNVGCPLYNAHLEVQFLSGVIDELLERLRNRGESLEHKKQNKSKKGSSEAETSGYPV